jgi:hypothetical protein
LREEDRASLEIAMGGSRAVGIRHFEEVHFRQGVLEFGRRLFFRKLITATSSWPAMTVARLEQAARRLTSVVRMRENRL